MLKRILVLVGPSTDSKQPAIARAAALAKAAGAGIDLLDAVYDPHLVGYLGRSDMYASLRERLLAERRERLRSLVSELEARGLRCTAKAEWSHPAHRAVVREAASPDVDLVILEPQDRDGLSNDEWRLISISPTPVLVVRDPAVRPYEAVVAGVDPDSGDDKPPDLDERILDLAKRFGALAGARLEVVHCMPLFRSFIASDASALGDAEEALKARRKGELDRLVEQAGLPSDAATLIEGLPADALAQKSSSTEPTLLVLGTVQRGPIARLLVGSTTERVLRKKGGDVAVVQPAFLGLAPDAEDDESSRHTEGDPSEVS